MVSLQSGMAPLPAGSSAVVLLVCQVAVGKTKCVTYKKSDLKQSVRNNETCPLQPSFVLYKLYFLIFEMFFSPPVLLFPVNSTIP